MRFTAFDRIRTHFPSGSSYAGVNLDRRRKVIVQASDLAVHSWQRHSLLKPDIPHFLLLFLSVPKQGGVLRFGVISYAFVGYADILMSSPVKLITNHLLTCAE